MKTFAYVLAAIATIAIAAPTITSAETVIIKRGHHYHHRGPGIVIRDHHRWHHGRHHHYGWDHHGWRHHDHGARLVIGH